MTEQKRNRPQGIQDKGSRDRWKRFVTKDKVARLQAKLKALQTIIDDLKKENSVLKDALQELQQLMRRQTRAEDMRIWTP